MSLVLPREKEVEQIFSRILSSPEACERLAETFYSHLCDDSREVDPDLAALRRSSPYCIQKWRCKCRITGTLPTEHVRSFKRILPDPQAFSRKTAKTLFYLQTRMETC